MPYQLDTLDVSLLLYALRCRLSLAIWRLWAWVTPADVIRGVTFGEPDNARR